MPLAGTMTDETVRKDNGAQRNSPPLHVNVLATIIQHSLGSYSSHRSCRLHSAIQHQLRRCSQNQLCLRPSTSALKYMRIITPRPHAPTSAASHSRGAGFLSRACAIATAPARHCAKCYDIHGIGYQRLGMVCAATRAKCACNGSALFRRFSAAIMLVDKDNTTSKFIRSNSILCHAFSRLFIFQHQFLPTAPTMTLEPSSSCRLMSACANAHLVRQGLPFWREMKTA